jgi:hypothetical protein
MENYPWYSVVNKIEKPQQGDFINDLPIFFPELPVDSPKIPSDKDTYSTEVKIWDCIILSQSCDLEKGKIKTVLVCPYKPYSEFKIGNSFYGKDEGKNALLEGTAVSYFLLNECIIEGFCHDYLVVDFRNTNSVPLEIVNHHLQKFEYRLRLLPPYREHLAQNFARSFMRIGHPVTFENEFLEKFPFSKKNN